MQRLFDLAITDKTISAESSPASTCYLTDPAFRSIVEHSVAIQHRISLATLEQEKPAKWSDRAAMEKLYELRTRMRAALSALRDEHERYLTEHPSRPFSGRAGRPGTPSRAAWQTGAGATTDLSSATSRHEHTSGDTA